MDYENNDLGQVELAQEQFQPELDQSISQHMENAPLVVIITTNSIYRIKSLFNIDEFISFLFV